MYISPFALPPAFGRYESTPREDDVATDFHGTCMASKAVGEMFGVSEKASLTIVRRPTAILTDEQIRSGWTSNSSPTPQIVLGLTMILEDVRRRQNGPSSILAFSSSCTPPDGRITPGSEWSVHPADYPNNINHPLFQVLRDLSDEGVTIVTSTGNQGTDDPAQPFHGPDSYRITSMPAIFNDRLPIIAVGSIKNDGTPSPIQPYLAYPPFWPNAEIDVYAPGYPAICDQGPLHRYGAPVYGSSAPTASVAGLVAYYLGTRGHVDLIHQEWVRDGRKTPRSWAETVKAYVVGRSYERQYRQPLPLGPPQASNAVWNGETEPGSCPVPAAVASTDKRQADDSPSDKSSSCAISCRIYPNHVDFTIIDAFSTRLKQETSGSTLYTIGNPDKVFCGTKVSPLSRLNCIRATPLLRELTQ